MSARTNLYVHSHVSWEQLWWRIVGEMRSMHVEVELGLETHNRFVLERLDWQIMSPQNFMHSFHLERRVLMLLLLGSPKNCCVLLLLVKHSYTIDYFHKLIVSVRAMSVS